MSIASRVQAVISPELTALIESETVDASKPIIAIFTVIDGLPDIEATVDFVIKAAEQLTQRKAIKVNLLKSIRVLIVEAPLFVIAALTMTEIFLSAQLNQEYKHLDNL